MDHVPKRLPGQGSDLTTDLADWAFDPSWVELVEAFGADPKMMPATLHERLTWLDEFSDIWDFRQGRLERDEVGEIRLSTAQIALVDSVSRHLNMRSGARPMYDEYDHVVALGGLIRACFFRPLAAAHLMQSGQVRSGSFIGLGGHRRFSDEERSLARSVGRDDLDDEFSALDAGTREAFHLGDPVLVMGEQGREPGGTWSLHEYRAESGLRVLVGAAPSSEPLQRRANTADAYHWMAQRLAHLEPGQRVLAVTTPIYVPAQHCAAVAQLGLRYGVIVDTIGVRPASVAPAWQQEFSPTRYLMEFRSIIRGLRSLLSDVEQQSL